MSVNAVGIQTQYRNDNVAAASGAGHIVQRGETLSGIAARYGVSLDALLAANRGIVNPNLIYPDQRINLPSGAGTGVAPTGPVSDNGGSQPSGMSLSQAGLDMIKGFEGLRLTAYQDSAGVWTIGYGHTGPDVRPGMTITQARAEQLLRQDVARFEQAVRDAVRVPLTQNQFDALVSFSFNVGAGAFRGSTLLSKLNAGDYAGAQAEFGRWVHAGGQRLEGLVRRRTAEAELFGGRAPEGGGSSPPSNPPSSGPSAGTYTVRSGDTLSGIAQRHGVSLGALLAHPSNGAFRGNPDLIRPGQVVHIPGGGATPSPTPPPSQPQPPTNGQVPTYQPWTVYSTGPRPAISITHPDQMQAHHTYQTRERQGQTLEVRDVVLHRPGQSQTAQPVPSPVSGRVETVAYQADGAGHYVILRSDRGELVYLFHFSSVGVKQGQRVEYGQALGNQGSTGRSTGPHVHIEAPSSVIDRWVHDLLDGRFDGVRTN